MNLSSVCVVAETICIPVIVIHLADFGMFCGYSLLRLVMVHFRPPNYWLTEHQCRSLMYQGFGVL